MSHGRVSEWSIKFFQEAWSFYHEAYVDEKQPKFAVVLLCELDRVLFDSAERLECLFLAQVYEDLEFDDAESILVFKLLLDSLSLFFGCVLNKFFFAFIINAYFPLLKTFEFSLYKDECSNNICLVVNIVHLERPHCLRLDNLEIDVGAAQRVKDV